MSSQVAGPAFAGLSGCRKRICSCAYTIASGCPCHIESGHGLRKARSWPTLGAYGRSHADESFRPGRVRVPGRRVRVRAGGPARRMRSGRLGAPRGARASGTAAHRHRPRPRGASPTSSAEAQALHDQGLAIFMHTSGSRPRARSTRPCASTRAGPGLGRPRAAPTPASTTPMRRESRRTQARGAGRRRGTERERRRVAPAARTSRRHGRPRRPGAARAPTSARSTRRSPHDRRRRAVAAARQRRGARRRPAAGSAARRPRRAFYRRALAVSPDHFAAHHYLIHSYEKVGRIAEALPTARPTRGWPRRSRTRTTCTGTTCAGWAAWTRRSPRS